MARYGKLCDALLESDYTLVTVHQYLADPPDCKMAILRHDVDYKPINALKMAKLEHSLEISSSYYFRYPATFIPEVIKEIHDLGHEIGYHYEVLAKADGDYEKAIRLFAQELKEFRFLYDIQTICMHGSPLSRYDNRDLWQKFDFTDYGIVGEAYLSMFAHGLCYLTDTGRNWSGNHSVRDVMSDTASVQVQTTDDLTQWIKSGSAQMLYLNVHPHRWAMNGREWVISSFVDFTINVGKSFLKVIRT